MGESSTGPLSGIRILELTTTVSGPMAAMTLADQGADVIKIEPPLVGDPARYLGPSRGGVSSMFASLNRNKRSVVLDLKDDDERAVFLRLVETADVLIENYRPGVLDRLGLGYETLSALRPELVYASITGYGDGPYQNRRVFDPLIQATSGTAAAQGIDEATNVRTVIFDKVTALTTAQGVTAALLERERTGRGQHLPVTMLESALSYQWPDVMWSHSFVGDGVSDGPAELADWFPLFRAKDGPVAIILTSDQAVELLSVWRAAELHLDLALPPFTIESGTARLSSSRSTPCWLTSRPPRCARPLMRSAFRSPGSMRLTRCSMTNRSAISEAWSRPNIPMRARCGSLARPCRSMANERPASISRVDPPPG